MRLHSSLTPTYLILTLSLIVASSSAQNLTSTYLGTNEAIVKTLADIQAASNGTMGPSFINSMFFRNESSVTPIIGILTQPVSAARKPVFPYDQYILEVNKVFVELSGAIAVPIQFDITDAELYLLLDSINGVLFTGGGLTLIDNVTGVHHEYYKTAKKIFTYSITHKDTTGVDFPLLGLCQGFQLLSLLASGDVYNLLEVLPEVNTTRKVNFTIAEPHLNSRLFSSFSTQLITKMQTEPVAFHYHNWGVTLQDYQQISPLNSFFKVLSTDLANGTIEYVTAVESHNYSIYGFLYHPEYQMLTFSTQRGFSIIPNIVTFDIIQLLSTFLHSEASKHVQYRNTTNTRTVAPLNLYPLSLQYAVEQDVQISAYGVNKPFFTVQQLHSQEEKHPWIGYLQQLVKLIPFESTFI